MMDLISFEDDEIYTQNAITPLQPVQQPMPNWGGAQYDYAAKMEGNYQYNIALDRWKAEIDISKYRTKRQIDEAHARRMEVAKADIQIKREMLSDTFHLTTEGYIIRKQECLTEKPIEYCFANLRINSLIKYTTKGSSSTILYILMMTQNQEERVLCLNLGVERAGYYWKKFREAGIVFKKKRNDRGDLIFNIVQMLADKAQIVCLPQRRGFYRNEDQSLHYAGKETLLWKDVEGLAM